MEHKYVTIKPDGTWVIHTRRGDYDLDKVVANLDHFMRMRNVITYCAVCGFALGLGSFVGFVLLTLRVAAQ